MEYNLVTFTIRLSAVLNNPLDVLRTLNEMIPLKAILLKEIKKLFGKLPFSHFLKYFFMNEVMHINDKD